jgi:hypothetical protein
MKPSRTSPYAFTAPVSRRCAVKAQSAASIQSMLVSCFVSIPCCSKSARRMLRLCLARTIFPASEQAMAWGKVSKQIGCPGAVAPLNSGNPEDSSSNSLAPLSIQLKYPVGCLTATSMDGVEKTQIPFAMRSRSARRERPVALQQHGASTPIACAPIRWHQEAIVLESGELRLS